MDPLADFLCPANDPGLVLGYRAWQRLRRKGPSPTGVHFGGKTLNAKDLGAFPRFIYHKLYLITQRTVGRIKINGVVGPA